jgi:hypothetical protein
VLTEAGEVDLGYINTADTGFSIKFKPNFVNDGTWKYRGIFGNNDLAFGTQTDFRAYRGSKKSFSLGISSTVSEWHTVCVNYTGSGEVTVDGSADKGWNSGNNPSNFNETLRVFSAGSNTAFTSGGAIRLPIAEIVITEKGSVVKTYKAARREEDGNVGFLDIDTDTFWPSTGAVYGPTGFEATNTLEYDDDDLL